MDLEEFFYGLEGKWNLSRTVNTTNSFHGEVQFVASKLDNQLICREDCFDMNDNSYNKNYYYSLKTPFCIQIFLRPNKKDLFTEFTKENINRYSVYICGNDTYAFKITPCSKNKFITQCKIYGPKKDLLIETINYR
ncbi:MAG: DUF6314 family protein [Rickettsiales bacterium]